MAAEKKREFHESATSLEKHFKRMIENRFNGSSWVAEKLLEMASYKVVGDTFLHSYAIEIGSPELEINTKTKLTFYPEEKWFWLEIWKAGEVIYGETNIGVKRMELNEDNSRVIIVRSDNGKRIHLGKDGRIGTL